MKRAIGAALAIIFILLLVGGGLIAFVQARDEVTVGNLSRQAEPRVFWGGGETAVSLRYTPSPNVVCPPIRRAANVLLLVDKSESMAENDAFASAVAAAEAYIGTMDFTVSRAGVVFFDDAPELAAPPSQDAAALRAALSGYTPQSTTDIAAALMLADTTFANLAAQGSSVGSLPAVIVLLTDGQATDPAAAAAVGQRLKDSGIRLITVGVGQADNAFLFDLASSPTDHFEVADPEQLPTLYAELAAQLKSAVAFDMNLVEPLGNNLQLLPESVVPAADIANNTLTWNVASVDMDGATFSYRATVDRLGLHNVNSGDTVMGYTDCIAGAVTTSLPPGPQLLVLPPAWMALALLLLPLLPLLFMGFFRRSRPDPEPPRERSAAPLPEPEPVDLTPAWLTRLTDTRTLSESGAVETSAEKWTPTLIMGVGPVGRVVLPQIAQALRGRFGDKWPSEVRLLQIDIQPKGSTLPLERPEYLLPEQWILLEPDLDEVRRNLDRARDRFAHLDWYPPTAPGYDRSRARMAVFYDLKDGASQSRLWQALSAATVGLDKPKLRLVGSTFDDSASGILIDMARLVQILARTDVDVEMWLSLPVGQDWSTRLHNPRQKVRVSEQATRTLATLRELERFQRNAPVPFHYVADDHLQTQLHDEARMAVIQTLFLFEPVEGAANVTDHLTTLTDALLAVLPTESQQAVAQHLSRMNRRAGDLINREGIGMACSMGAFAVRLPLETLAEALSWRMLHDLLYDTRIGLLPLARLTEDGTYERVELFEFQAGSDAEAVRQAADRFVSRFGGRVDSSAFRNHVARAVSDILNGESDGGQPILQRVGGLVKAQEWLQSVRAVLLQDGQTTAASLATELEDRLFAWQRVLIEELRPEVDARLQRSQAALAALAGQANRQWVVPEGLDWGAYRDRVRPWTTGLPTRNPAGEPLLRAGQRFGWHVTFNELTGAWTLDLLAPEGAFVWSEDGVDLSALAVRRQARDVIAPLYHLTYAATRSRAEIRADWVLDVAMEIDPGAWLRRADTRLRFNGQEASGKMGGGLSETVILVAPESGRTLELRDRLTKTQDRSTVTVAQTKDATSATLLRIRDRVPIYTLTNWGEDAWERQNVMPSLYVWQGEQRAAEIETDVSRLSPMFVGWLERDPQLLDRFAQAYLFGLYDQYAGHANLPGLGQWPANSVGEALDNLMGREDAFRPSVLSSGRNRERREALRVLDAALELRRQELWQSPGKSTFLRGDAVMRLDALRAGGDRRESDLARYVQAIINQL